MRLHFRAALLAGSLALPQSAIAENKGSVLNPNGVLLAANNDSISAPIVKFVMQSDCNLVAYQGNSAVWSSKTNGKGANCKAIMQADGNLVVYRADNKALWSSGTFKFAGGRLVAQNDGNVVIYQGNVARWSTQTNIPKPPGGNGGAGSQGPFPGCHYAKTQTKCVVVTYWLKEVYQCGWNANNMTPIEKSTNWHIAGACLGFDW